MKRITVPPRKGYPLVPPGKVKIPKQIEVPIFLIMHELRLRMIYNAFKPIATIDCYLESHLDRLILASLKMWDGKDETYTAYYSVMNKWAKDINSDPEVIKRRAIKICNYLVQVREKSKRVK